MPAHVKTHNTVWLPWIMSLRYLCLFAYSGVQYILCWAFALFFFVLCTISCRFLWIVHFWLPLRYSLTFILKYLIDSSSLLPFIFTRTQYRLYSRIIRKKSKKQKQKQKAKKRQNPPHPPQKKPQQRSNGLYILNSAR